MPKTVFFSWQVDTPPKEGRNLIERAFARAVDRIGDDTTIEAAVRELAVDRDTKGVSGFPPILDLPRSNRSYMANGLSVLFRSHNYVSSEWIQRRLNAI